MSVDFFALVMSYITTNGKLLFSLFSLGLAFFVNNRLSNALLTFSILSFVLFFLFSDVIFIALASVAIVVGLFFKNIAQ